MSTTLNERVREQILAEGPQIGEEMQCERYIDAHLLAMTNVELLKLISDALPEALEKRLAALERDSHPPLGQDQIYDRLERLEAKQP